MADQVSNTKTYGLPQVGWFTAWRKAYVKSVLPTLLLLVASAIVVQIFISQLFTPLAWVFFMVSGFILLGLVGIISYRLNYKRVNSLKFVVGPDSITQQADGVPDLTIYREDVLDIKESRFGISVRTKDGAHRIIVTKAFDGYDQIKGSLNDWMTIQPETSLWWRFVGWVMPVVVLITVGVYAGSNSPYLIIPVVIIWIIISAWTARDMRLQATMMTRDKIMTLLLPLGAVAYGLLRLIRSLR